MNVLKFATIFDPISCDEDAVSHREANESGRNYCSRVNSRESQLLLVGQ